MTRLKILGIITAIAALGGVALSTTGTQASADEGVPEWFKGVAAFWAEGNISTAEFLDSVEFLIEQEIITVPGFGPIAEAQAEGVDQATVDELWEAIGELQGQLETMSTGDTLAELSCDPGQIVKYTSTGSWMCQDDATGATQSLKDMGLTTYVKYNTVGSSSTSLNCDSGDVVTGGSIGTLGGKYSTMYPLPVHSNPSKAMYDPNGWTGGIKDSTSIDIWIVCLDLTPGPQALSLTSIPKAIIPKP